MFQLGTDSTPSNTPQPSRRYAPIHLLPQQGEKEELTDARQGNEGQRQPQVIDCPEVEHICSCFVPAAMLQLC
ncbi:hypothetical protein MES5069_380044 [Mesorhizobium escarrei]|uniref:Uncharacterized protein n=1 Tax=Mesorhizobium escarrei TaxID=666018 RepID=A0ABM9E347_9HYPH|nr:hypothetical protein MES5069_380044 [Mesorhizobium escarrei]